MRERVYSSLQIETVYDDERQQSTCNIKCNIRIILCLKTSHIEAFNSVILCLILYYRFDAF